MTTILKHDEDTFTEPVRILDWNVLGSVGATPAIDPELAGLRAEAARLAEDLASLEAGEPARIAAARAAGRKEAESAYKADEEARLKALQTGLDAAIEAARPAFANVEKIAILLAERAIANAFGDAGDYRDQIARAVRHQAALIGARSVLRLEVSADDFNNEQVLSELADEFDTASVEIVAIGELKEGQARLCLMLGEVEIDLPRYWSEVKALLSDLAERPNS